MFWGGEGLWGYGDGVFDVCFGVFWCFDGGIFGGPFFAAINEDVVNGWKVVKRGGSRRQSF